MPQKSGLHRHFPFVLLSLAILSGRSAEAQVPFPLAQKPKPLATIDLPDWGTSVAFSPDGNMLVAGTYEKVVLIDVRSNETIRELKVHSGYARGVAWSPDGQWIAAGCFGAVEIWNVADGNRTQQFKNRGYANDVAFSPEGSLIAAAGEDGAVRLWNPVNGEERESLKGLKDPAQGIAFSPDGAVIAVAAGDETRQTRLGAVKLWTLSDGSEPMALDVMPERCATDVAFSPDGKSLFVSDFNKRVTIYDLSNGMARAYFGKHSQPVTSVVVLKDGKTAISAAGGQAKDGNDIQIWKIADGDPLAVIEHHGSTVTDIAVSADETRLASVSMDKTVAIWDLTSMLNHPAEPNASLETEQSRSAAAAFAAATAVAARAADDAESKVVRIGVIGLDTSHAVEFTRIINQAKTAPLNTCRVVAAFPKGSPDIESSVSRVPQYTKDVEAQGVEIVDSIETLLKQVDVVLLETNDGRPHLEQVLPVLAARKPVFIDKPLAGSLADCVAIFEAAKHYGTPIFSSSSLRYTDGAQAARRGESGKVLGCEAYSPCHLEATHPDLFWYGIHGVEELFTAMGTGCESVSRTSTPDVDVAVGAWEGGRVGSFRGIRKGKSGYGGTVFGEKAITPLGDYGGYEPLVVKIVEFFHTGESPVAAEETLEIYAFMEAADESKRQGGRPVTLESVLTAARESAKQMLSERLGKDSPK